MSVGIQQSKAQIDGTSGGLIIELENILSRVERYALWLQSVPDATLLGLGYVQAEVNILKSAYVSDMIQMLAVYRGTATQVALHDFRVFTHQLWSAGL